MDIFDFEELVADMLDITDEQREDDDCLQKAFYNRFGIELDEGYELAKALLSHTIPVESGFNKINYHAFVSRNGPVMLMKLEAASS